MVAENRKFSEFSETPLTAAQAQTLLQSQEGQNLVRLLQKDGGVRLRQAAQALQRGDTEGAKRLLSPLLGSEGEALGGKLQEKL